ncbi:MAG: hypothetical protein NHG12_00975 [Candidatus Shikimatogenerans bostrichidophilus]|nr:MAG: hypothetical protein NHG12_00975 [Candidatus Shikimatogenerans bostrichidophilus]
MNKLKKIIKLRKLTNFSILICKKSLEKNKFNIKKSFKYLIKKENKKYNILLKKKIKLNNGLVYSSINKKKNIGIILKINTESDYIINNNFFKKFLIKINKIIFKKKIKNKNKLLKNKNIKNEILKNIIRFKENIIISKFYYFKDDYINYYNHYNYKITSIVSFKLKNKIYNKKIIKNISNIIAIYIIIKNLNIKLKYINKYFLSKKILLDNNFIKKIKLNKNEYLKYFKNNIYINNYKLLNL